MPKLKKITIKRPRTPKPKSKMQRIKERREREGGKKPTKKLV